MIQLSCNNKMDPKRKGKSNISNKSNICSININALNNKLTSIRNSMQNNFIDIMCAQETHEINRINFEKCAKFLNYTIYTNQIYDTPKLKHAKEDTAIIISRKIKDNFVINPLTHFVSYKSHFLNAHQWM